MEILDLVLFSTSLVSILILLYLIVKSNINKRKIFALYIQSEMHKHMLGQKIDDLQKELSSKELSETDGFIKFISQSRDWAFEYIEEVQKALSEFDEEVSPKFKSAKDSNKLLKEISLAYDKLKTVLPKDNQTPNN